MSVRVEIPYSELKENIEYTENIVKRIYANRRNRIAEAFIDYCTPFVPIKSGALRSSATVVDNGYGVEWSATNPKSGYDYASVQYEVPFEHPRGGTDHWDREMLFYEGDAFLSTVEEILTK